jgi:hypothetical protein
MSFLFGVMDSEDKKNYDSSLKFPKQNVTVSKSDVDEADMYDLNFGVEIPVYDVEYFKKLRELSMEIFKIFDMIAANIPSLFTNDKFKLIISKNKKLLLQLKIFSFLILFFHLLFFHFIFNFSSILFILSHFINLCLFPFVFFLS